MSDEFNKNEQDSYNGNSDYANGMNEENNINQGLGAESTPIQNSNVEYDTNQVGQTGSMAASKDYSDQNSDTVNYSDQSVNNQGYSNDNINTVNYSGIGSEQSMNHDYNTTDNNTYQNYHQMNNQTGSSNTYPIYPTPQVFNEKKPKKKRKIFGAFKLTAAALAFGIIAGAAFQGYYLVGNMISKATGTASDTQAKVTETAKDTSDKDTIVPATSTTGDAVATDVSDVAEKVMPSIVAINSKVTTKNYDFFGQEVDQDAQASGSGIIIAQNDSNLLIVTNNHVIDGASLVEIVFSDDSKASAVVKGADANTDLAILSVDMNDLSEKTASTIKVATLGSSDSVEIGDMAIAIGNALGYGQSVTVGYISAVNREVEINNNKTKLLQTDAAINPGNSGGALLNSKGEVIGINSVKYASTEVEGMGYAIPISKAIPMIDELMNRKTVTKSEQGYLGIDASTAQNVTSDYAERFHMPVGIYINDVIKNSPAEKAGMVQGDIITGVDSVSVETIDDLVSAMSYKQAGQQISLKIQTKENGSYVEKTLKITLGKK